MSLPAGKKLPDVSAELGGGEHSTPGSRTALAGFPISLRILIVTEQLITHNLWGRCKVRRAEVSFWLTQGSKSVIDF